VGIDEIYPEFHTPLPLQFSQRDLVEDPCLCQMLRRSLYPKWKPLNLVGSWNRKGEQLDLIRCPNVRHMAKQYSWRNIRLVIEPWHSVVVKEWNLTGGVSLLAGPMDPRSSRNLELDTTAVYLTWLWRNKDTYTGKARPIPALGKWIKHMELQPASRTQCVYLRPCSPNGREDMVHLKETNYIPSKRMTTANLKKAYAEVLGAYETGMPDSDGEFYWTVPFKAKDPVPDLKPFPWPKLLERRMARHNL
jgi:hypothetical protein